MTATREARFAKIWVQMRDWERKQYSGQWRNPDLEISGVGRGGGVHPDPEIRGTPGLKKILFGSSGLRDNSDDRSSRCGILVKKGRASGIRIPFSRP